MKLKVGGVPEHYNLPWHWTWENHLLEGLPIDYDWKSYPNGTGAMCQDLRSGDIDIAVILSEGIIQDIAEGNPSKLVAVYVNSPLRWGVHAPAQSTLSDQDLIKKGRYAISRPKSGSHLMAHVHAKEINRVLDEKQDFVKVENLDGARKSFAQNESELFLWERFTTKFLVDAGEFKYLGDCYTPWPSFVIVAREEVLKERAGDVQALVYFIQSQMHKLLSRSDLLQILTVKYNLKEADAAEWLAKLEWNEGEFLPKQKLESMINQMKDFNLLQPEIKLDNLILPVEV